MKTSLMNNETSANLDYRKQVSIRDFTTDDTYYFLLDDSQINLLTYLIEKNIMVDVEFKILDDQFVIV